MRRTLLFLFVSMLACTLAGCPFFTREDPAPAGAERGPSAPAVDEHAGHDHP